MSGSKVSKEMMEFVVEKKKPFDEMRKVKLS